MAKPNPNKLMQDALTTDSTVVKGQKPGKVTPPGCLKSWNHRRPKQQALPGNEAHMYLQEGMEVDGRAVDQEDVGWSVSIWEDGA